MLFWVKNRPSGIGVIAMTDLTLPAAGTFDFTGKTAIVTGAGSGVGEAIARELHRGGCNVAVTDAKPELAKEVATSLDPDRKSAIAITLDVRNRADFEAARDAILQTWGRIDIVINNAGWGKRAALEDITPEEFDDVSNVNMRSVFLSCQCFAPLLKDQGHGRIVNITSLAGQNGGTVAAPHYAASKAGAIMLTKYFARDLAPFGVTVNAISPGPIDTAKQRLSPEQIARVEAQVPIGRFMHVEEIACATALLASDKGGFFVGATLDMNGGLYLR
jgi:3-oxoacyl-[acyl-carrier protein] reductase